MENRLIIKFDDNGTISDLSQDLEDFGRDPVPIAYVAAEDKLYVGYYKPFKRFFVEFNVANSSELGISVKQYINGSFTEVESRDETKGFTRSGYLRFNNSDDWALSDIDGTSAYWVRIDLDSDVGLGFSIQGLNEIFSTDDDLREEYAEIKDFLPDGEDSFILKHQSSKKKIIQMIRNAGQKKARNRSLAHINAFDFHFPDAELREASKFLTLHKIFKNIHDTQEGLYAGLARDFKNEFESAYESLFLAIDYDDDGKVDNSERERINTVQFIRQ